MVFSVLDASAFYAGIPFASSEKRFTTQEVFDEVKHIKRSHNVVETLLETNRLEIMSPDPLHVLTVLQKSKNSGDFPNLSSGDISVIALSLQLKAELITDDFAVSNLAKCLNLRVVPIMTKGITRIVKWIYFCSGCQKTFSRISQCPLCGNKLSRRLGKTKYSSSRVTGTLGT